MGSCQTMIFRGDDITCIQERSHQHVLESKPKPIDRISPSRCCVVPKWFLFLSRLLTGCITGTSMLRVRRYNQDQESPKPVERNKLQERRTQRSQALTPITKQPETNHTDTIDTSPSLGILKDRLEPLSTEGSGYEAPSSPTEKERSAMSR